MEGPIFHFFPLFLACLDLLIKLHSASHIISSVVNLVIRVYVNYVRYYESELQAQLIPTHHPKPKPLIINTFSISISPNNANVLFIMSNKLLQEHYSNCQG